MSLAALTDRARTLDAERRALVSQKEDLVSRAAVRSNLADAYGRAADILRSFSDDQSQRLVLDVERLVSHGLTSVFGEPLEFNVHTRMLRGSPAVEFSLVDANGVDRPVLGARGGGLAQVVSFVLRVVVLMLSGNRKLLVLDEPFSMVSAEYRPRLAAFVRELVDGTALQLVVVTHDPDLPEVADRHYRLRTKDGATILEEAVRE